MAPSLTDIPTLEKKHTDYDDIVFLLRFCAKNLEELPEPHYVPNATKDFVQSRREVYGCQKEWTQAGYDMEKGSCCLFLFNQRDCY